MMAQASSGGSTLRARSRRTTRPAVRNASAIIVPNERTGIGPTLKKRGVTPCFLPRRPARGQRRPPGFLTVPDPESHSPAPDADRITRTRENIHVLEGVAATGTHRAPRVGGARDRPELRGDPAGP